MIDEQPELLRLLPEPSDTEFQLFATLIEREAGIHLAPIKKPLLVARLLKRVRALGLRSFGAYYRHVVHEDPEELIQLLDAISTNETHFFREPHHFEFLARQAVPMWRQAARQGQRERRVRLWSAGCSSGEEPYSLAMQLLDGLHGQEGWILEILATDLSTRVLDRARAAVYPLERLASVSLDMRRRYLLRGVGSQDGRIKVGPEARAVVSFDRLNLCDPIYPSVPRSLDAVFCRNVLIYFQRELRDRVVRQLYELLRPGGYLFLGHAESLPPSQLALRSCGNTIYQKVDKKAAP